MKEQEIEIQTLNCSMITIQMHLIQKYSLMTLKFMTMNFLSINEKKSLGIKIIMLCSVILLHLTE